MEGRGGTPVVATPSGLIYVVGGFAGREMADIHVYSVDTDTWATCEQVVWWCTGLDDIGQQ